MQYHMFKGINPRCEGRWLMFLYETPETCVETWNFDPKYGLHVYKRDTADIPIEKRIFILGTTQNGQVTQNWEHQEVNETDAYFMMLDAEKE